MTKLIFKQVLFSDNTESNKRDELEKIYKDKNIKNLETSDQLYKIFDKKEMMNRVIESLISKPELIERFIT